MASMDTLARTSRRHRLALSLIAAVSVLSACALTAAAVTDGRVHEPPTLIGALIGLAIVALVVAQLDLKSLKVGVLEASFQERAAAANANEFIVKSVLAELQASGALAAAPAPMAVVEPSPAPALARAVIDPADPNKGRFGGQAQAGGYRLVAAFRSGPEASLVQVDLAVEATGGALLGPVQFFLHPTFPNPSVWAPASGNAARLSLTVWGGFTIGAWLPPATTGGPGVELELDLALLPDAPRLVREA